MIGKPKPLAFLLVALAISGPLGAQTGALKGSDFMLEDNSLDIHYGEDKIIDFLKATYHPGEGIIHSYSMDVVEFPYEIHGIGVATTESIVQSGPSTYTVKAKVRIPAVVTIGPGYVDLGLGDEVYRVKKSGPDFLVEVHPLLPGARADPDRSLGYGISPGKKSGPFQFITRGYSPFAPPAERQKLDREAIFVPKETTMRNGVLKADTFTVEETIHPSFGYEYSISLAKDRSVNLKNYLILLTQRQEEGAIPLLHPVLLTVYFFDSLMAKP